MNILILSNIELSGEWISLQTLVTEIKNTRKDINFFLIAYGKNSSLLNFNLFKKISFIPKAPLIRPFRYYRQLGLRFLLAAKAIRELKKSRIHFDYSISTEYSLALPAFFVVPSTHSIFFFQGFRHGYQLKLKNFNFYMWLKKFLERFCWFCSTTMTVPSSYAYNIIRQELGIFSFIKKVHIFPNIVRSEFFRKYSTLELANFRTDKLIPLQKKIIVFSGIIDRRKSLKQLIDAFIHLYRKNKNFFLIIAHITTFIDKPYRKDLHRLLKKNRFSSNILFLQDLSATELAMLYQTASVAVLPSKLDMGSLFLLESLASRLPILSTAVGNAKEYLEKIDSFFILKDYKPSTIYKSLLAFFQKPPDWQKDIKLKLQQVSNEVRSKSSIKKFMQLIQP